MGVSAHSVGHPCLCPGLIGLLVLAARVSHGDASWLFDVDSVHPGEEMAHSVGGRASAYASTGLVSDPVTNRLKTQDSEHSLLVSQLTHPLRSQSVGAPALHATTSSHQPCQHEPFKHLVFLTTCIAFDPQTPLLAVVIPSSHQPFMPAVHSHSLCRPGSSESIHSKPSSKPNLLSAATQGTAYSLR